MNRLKTHAMAALLGLVYSVGHASAESAYVSGAAWQASNKAEKLAYVMGIANVVNAEHSVQKSSSRPPGNNQSAIPQLYSGLQGVTLSGMVEALDNYFSSNPDKTGDTVLDVLWIIYVEG